MNRHFFSPPVRGLALLLGLLLLLGACDQPTPIIVYITASPTPSLTPTETPPPTLTPTPSVTPTALPTATPIPPTATPIPPTETPFPTNTPIPPTETPLPTVPPTETPLPTLTFTPSATPPLPPGFVVPTLDSARIGIQVDVNLSDSDWDAAMEHAETLGVGWIKVQVAWEAVQPSGPDQRDEVFFRIVELHIEDANRRGFDVLVSVAKAPAWARSNQTEDGPPDDPAHLANFISLLLNEINAGDRPEDRALFGEYIDAIEVWNEPNLRREWQGTLPFDGAGYMRLFALAYQAIRAYSATMPIITAGLAPTGFSDGSIDDRTFLDQMYAAGLRNYPDVFIGVHPYSWANPPDATCCGTQGWDDNPHFFFADNMRDYRAVRDRAGAAHSFWITEIGYGTWDGYPPPLPPGNEWMAFNDRWDQALYTIRLLEIAQAAPDIRGTILWNLNFANPTLLLAGDEMTAYSLIVPGTLGAVDITSTDRTERPLYWMLHDATRPDVLLTSW